jgi:hypothetical protein
MSGAQLVQVQTIPAKPTQGRCKPLGFLGAWVGADEKKNKLDRWVESSAPGQGFSGSTQCKTWALQATHVHGRKACAKVESPTSEQLAIQRLETVKKHFLHQTVRLLQNLTELVHDAMHRFFLQTGDD